MNNIKIKPPEFYNKKLYDKDYPKIILLYKKNFTLSQIAKKFCVKFGAIKRVLKKNNIELKDKGYYNKKLTEINELEIIKLYEQGLTKGTLAKEFNISTPTITKVLNRNNVKSREKYNSIKVTEDIEKEIINLYKNSNSANKIAKKLNLSKSTICIKLHKHNLLKK